MADERIREQCKSDVLFEFLKNSKDDELSNEEIKEIRKAMKYFEVTGRQRYDSR